MGYTIKKKDRLVFYFLDFSKAFDTIEWDCKHNSLKDMNFWESFIRWILKKNIKIKGCVKNNNIVTEFYEISRGVRKGCPLSCLIFVIAVENLGTRIRKKCKYQRDKNWRKKITILK